MQLKDYIPLIDVKKRNIFFSGISFDSSKVKKMIFFLQSGVTILMEINLFQKQLKKVVKLL